MTNAPPTRNPKRQRHKEGAQSRRAAEVAALRRQQRNRRMIRIAVLAVVLIAALALVSFLGNDDDDEPVASDDTTATTGLDDAASTTAAPIPATPLTCEGPSGDNTDLSTKPTVEVPEAPVTELSCQDLVVGDGEEALNSNDVVQVHYVGVQQSDGKEFDTSWGGEPVSFSLDGVIPGWTQGIPGMKVGGRRVLTIPADMAYGDDASSGSPAGTLVFIVDLLDVNPDA